MNRRDEALSRTTRLLNEVFFDGRAEEALIGDGLQATRVRLTGDTKNLESRAAQATVVTACQLIARMGMVVELDLAPVPLVQVVPPLRQPILRDALLELTADLIPGSPATVEPTAPDLIFAIGSSPAPADSIRITAQSFSCAVTVAESARPITCEVPLGGIAAGAAVGAIALEAALPHIVTATGCPLTNRPLPSAGPPVDIDLLKLFPDLAEDSFELDRIDAVSGGAITNSFVQTLLWLPKAEADLRVIERESSDLTNVNRYGQLRASDEGKLKIDVLADASRGGIAISGVRALFNDATCDELLPLADTVVVGVDNVPARWWVQKEHPKFLVIGATDNQSAVLTTHPSGTPCAGCAHPDPLPELPEGDFIPTISLVSFWGGFLQALALLNPQRSARRITVFPFALGGGFWSHRAELPYGARCAIDCDASRTEAA